MQQIPTILRILHYFLKNNRNGELLDINNKSYFRMQKVSINTQQEKDNPTQVALNNTTLDHQKFDGLTKLHIWAYGVGHFINDLAAGAWFMYLLFYLKKVVNTQAAATALFAGQIADGIATPVVGLLSDKFNTRIGQRRPWYLFGLVLVIGCEIPLFFGYTSPENTAYEYAYYCIFASVFNFGWASLQISHMSLVPSLSCSRKRRDKLNNLRNTFTFVANLLVLGVSLIIFLVMNDKFLQFKILILVVISVGFLTSLFFLFKINEPKLSAICHQKSQILKQQIASRKQVDGIVVKNISEFSGEDESQDEKISQDQEPKVPVHQARRSLIRKKQSIWDWFKMPKFYLFGICYMAVRMYFNIFSSFLPFYLIDVMKMGGNDPTKVSFNLSLVPMLAYISSVVVTARLNWFYENIGRKKSLFLGTFICVACLAVMAVLEQGQEWMMYILSVFIGCSQSLVLSTGINFISDVVGSKAKTGAFVFGIYSLLDKFSCGIVILVIGSTASYSREKVEEVTQEDESFIRWTFVLIPGLACILSSLIVLSYPIDQYSTKKSKLQKTKTSRNSLEQQFIN